MKWSRFSEEQIVYAIRQAVSGAPIGDLCRQLGVSEATFYTWKKKYAHLGVSELRRLRQVEEENARLKWLVADLSLDKHMLTLRKKSEARPPPRTRPLVSGHLLGELCAGLSTSPVQSGRLVSEESGQGSSGLTVTDSGSGSRPSVVWLSAHVGVAAAGGLARESETSATALSIGWVAAADARAVPETYGTASRTGPNSRWFD